MADPGVPVAGSFGESVTAAALELPAARSGPGDTLRRLGRNRLAVVGIAILVVVVIAAVFAPILALDDPLKMNPTDLFQGPSLAHPFGTDEFGRDLLSRILWGARVSLLVSLASVGIAVVFGTTLGLVGGFYGQLVDEVISRVLEVIFAFPSILLALGLVGMLGPSTPNLILAIAVVYTPVFGRLSRGTVLSVREREYVEAARACGASSRWIILQHILPNVASPMIVQASLSLSLAVLTEASLSFLGLGTQPPNPSWGSMVSSGQRLIEFSPWVVVFPGGAITLLVLAFNLLGDGLRDVLDPRLR